MSSLPQQLSDTAARHGDRPALKLDDAGLTYAEFDAAASRVAGLLRERGVQPGDPVGLMLPNVPYFPVVYYGILRAGAAIVPMNVLLKSREVSFYLSDPGAKILFAWHDFADAARAGAEEAGAAALIVGPGRFGGLLPETPPAPGEADRGGGDTPGVLSPSRP